MPRRHRKTDKPETTAFDPEKKVEKAEPEKKAEPKKKAAAPKG